jgi:uncharacterized membrane protein
VSIEPAGSMAMADAGDNDGERRDLVARVRALRRWVTALLILTAFLAGSVAGGAAIWWRQIAQPAGPMALARAVQALAEPAGRQAFRDAMVAGRRAARPQARETQEARAALAQVLADPAMPGPALQAALARLRQAEGALRESLEPRVAEVIAGFPPDRRRAIADAIAPAARRPGGAPRNQPGP